MNGRTQTQADCHRHETWTTPGGEETRYATINANKHADGTIKRDVYAIKQMGTIGDYRDETRTTTERPGSDMTYEARTRRTNRMAHKLAEQQQKERNQREAQNQLEYFEDRYGKDSENRPLILD